MIDEKRRIATLPSRLEWVALNGDPIQQVFVMEEAAERIRVLEAVLAKLMLKKNGC